MQFNIKKIEMGQDNARNLSVGKEEISNYRWIAENPRYRKATSDHALVLNARARFVTAVSVRVWMGRSASASTVYASVWLHSRYGEFSSGRGSAGGYGYHKESAAIDDAFCSAGVQFDKHWGGTGDTAVQHAIALVGHKLGYRTGGLL